jgi:hypothetical protein
VRSSVGRAKGRRGASDGGGCSIARRKIAPETLATGVVGGRNSLARFSDRRGMVSRVLLVSRVTRAN